MSLVSIKAQAEQTPEKVEHVIRRSRARGAAVDRVLVVYEKQAAHIYYEGPPPKGTPSPA
jgi:hypothetical protein